jgi:ABC-type transport system involved in multi-copper enzyme maturation permease subunit
MLATLIGRSATQGRLVVLGCFTVLAGLQVVIVGQAAAIEDTHGFSRMAEFVPAFLQRGLGSKSFLLVTFKGTVAFGYFHPVVAILVSVLAIYFVTEIAHEIESGLVDVTLARPVPRGVIVVRSLVLAAAVVIGAVLLMAAGSRVGLRLLASAAYDAPSASTTAMLLGHLAAVALSFAGIGLAIASHARRWSTAFTVAVLSVVVLYLVDFLAIGWRPMQWVAWISPFHYYPAFSILAGDATGVKNIAILLSAGAVFSAVGCRRFIVRDL